jgi:hypothetical protein
LAFPREANEHAAPMLHTDVADEDHAEFVQRQAAIASMATWHAPLAAAAAIGLASDFRR